MSRIAIVLMFISLAFLPFAFAETIVSHENEKYFFKDGKMEKFEGQYENTYHLNLENNRLTRTRVYDYQSKLITPDETVYQIESTLKSHPTNAARFGVPPLIRAVGRPGKDTVEIILIEDDFVTTSTSMAGTFIFSRAKRLK